MTVPPVLYVISFGHGRGEPPPANHVFDTRWLPNPFRRPDFRDLSGQDDVVQDWLFSQDGVQNWFESVLDVVGPSLAAAHKSDSRAVTVAFACEGGHDRSVAVAMRFAAAVRRTGMRVCVEHRDIHYRGGQQPHAVAHALE